MTPPATGDCFEAAYKQAKQFVESVGERDVRIVHAMAVGEPGTPIAGKRFSHGWCELGDTVFDTTSGRNVVMRREQYYALGVEVDTIRRFTWVEAMVAGVRAGHYGPWIDCDGDCCLEEALHGPPVNT